MRQVIIVLVLIVMVSPAQAALRCLTSELVGSDIDGAYTARIYAEADPGDQVLAIGGFSGSPMFIECVNAKGIYQHPEGGPLSTDINSNLFDSLPELEWDSYLTIGSLYADGTPFDENEVMAVGIDFSDFEADGCSLYVTDGAIYLQPGSPQAFPVDGRVLLAQLTIFGGMGNDVRFSANIHWMDPDGDVWMEPREITIFDFYVDCDQDGVFDFKDNCNLYNPDQADCNDNGIGDVCDIAEGTVQDCNSNGIPDICDIVENPDLDCNDNSLIDLCEIANNPGLDLDGNGIPDECECLADVNGSGGVEVNDLLLVITLWGSAGGAGDVNFDGIVDVHDVLIVVGEWGPCP